MSRVFDAAAQPEKESQCGLPKCASRLIRLLAFTGMRLGEAINLRWEYSRPEEIRIPRTETKQKEE
jgi:integrase